MDYSVKADDRQKGSLNFSGVIKGKSNSPIELIINVFLNDATKAPTSVTISGSYSNQGSFIFMTKVALPKTDTGFQGRRQ